MEYRKVHIGEVVANRVAELKLSNSAFAKSIGLQRQNVRKTVFDKHGLDTDLLIIISKALDYDFFQHYLPVGRENKKDYKEVKATITIEMEEKKQDKVFRFVFGENNIEIKDK